jgi:hypothetical protein
MKLKSPNDYPKKIIEIFKENKLYELGVKDCLKKGDISCILVNYNIYNKYIIIL